MKQHGVVLSNVAEGCKVWFGVLGVEHSLYHAAVLRHACTIEACAVQVVCISNVGGIGSNVIDSHK